MNVLTRLPGEFKYYANDVIKKAAVTLVPDLVVKMFHGESAVMPEISRWQAAKLMFNTALEMPQERQLAARILPQNVRQKIPEIDSLFNMGAAIFTGAYGSIKGQRLIKAEFESLVWGARYSINMLHDTYNRYADKAHEAGLKISETSNAFVINTYPKINPNTQRREGTALELARFDKDNLLRSGNADVIIEEFINMSASSKLGKTAQKLAKLQQQFPEITIITHTPPTSRYGHINPRKFRFELQFPADNDGNRLSYDFPGRDYQAHIDAIDSESFNYNYALWNAKLEATPQGWRVTDASGHFTQTFTRLQDAAAWYGNISDLVSNNPELIPFQDRLKPMHADIVYREGEGYFLHAIAKSPRDVTTIPSCGFRYGKTYSDFGAFKEEVLEPLQRANEKIAAAGKSLKLGYDYQLHWNPKEGNHIDWSRVYFVVTDDGREMIYPTLEELNAAYP